MIPVEKIASGAAFLTQVGGGASLGIMTGNVLVQATTGGSIPIDPALGAAYGAIGALFGLVTWLAKGRIERCEKREDKILDTEAEKTTTIREQTQVVAKSAEVAALAIEESKKATEESKRNGQKLDALQSQFATVARHVTELTRNVARLTDDEPRRR